MNPERVHVLKQMLAELKTLSIDKQQEAKEQVLDYLMSALAEIS